MACIFSYDKIFGETNIRTREFTRSGSKAEEGERKKERLHNGNNNGQAKHGARKHAWRTQAAWANVKATMGGARKVTKQ